MPATTICTGPCQRPIAPAQPSIEDLLDGNEAAAIAHHIHRDLCTECVADGHGPQPAAPSPAQAPAPMTNDTAPYPTVLCEACDRDITFRSQPTLLEAATAAEGVTAHPDHPTVCTRCMQRGYAPKPRRARRDIVLENCQFYIENGVGLELAARREGYASKANLDAVLRRWDRVDVSRALSANDPPLQREHTA